MKILYVSYEEYFARHGESKVARALLRGLAARGHHCTVLTPWSASDLARPPGARRGRGGQLRLIDEGVTCHLIEHSVPWFALLMKLAGARRARRAARRAIAAYLRRGYEAFERAGGDAPSILLTNGHPGVLDALAGSSAPIVAMPQTPTILPFGPCAPRHVDDEELGAYRRATAHLVFSSYMQSILSDHVTAPIHVTPYPQAVFGTGHFEMARRHDAGDVLIINPGVLKGSPLFFQIVDRMPELRFAAVPSWNTTPDVMRELRKRPNVHVRAYRSDVDELYRDVRALLVPSLWPEAFGLVAVEAMLRGIPVLASDHGGLREAKLGVDYSLPIRPLDFRRPAALPPQDPAPWVRALRDVLASSDRYRAISQRSRDAAQTYFDSAARSTAAVEAILLDVLAAQRSRQVDQRRLQLPNDDGP